VIHSDGSADDITTTLCLEHLYGTYSEKEHVETHIHLAFRTKVWNEWYKGCSFQSCRFYRSKYV